MKFFIYDENPVISLGVISLAKQQEIEICGVNSLSQLSSQLVNSGPAVIILSREVIQDQFDHLGSILGELASCRVMCLLDTFSLSAAKKLIDLGCSAAVLWNDIEEIIKCILALRETNYYLQPSLMTYLLGKHEVGLGSGELFTRREVEVLELIFEEYSAKEIAANLCLSVRTVEWYRKKMMEKVGAKNMVGLIKYGLNNELITIQKV